MTKRNMTVNRATRATSKMSGSKSGAIAILTATLLIPSMRPAFAAPAQCSEIFRIVENPLTIQPKTVPSLMSSIFSFSMADRKAAIEYNEKLAKSQAAYRASDDRALQQFNSSAREGLAPGALEARRRKLYENYSALMKRAKTPEDKLKYTHAYERTLAKLKSEMELLNREMNRAVELVSSKYKSAPAKYRQAISYTEYNNRLHDAAGLEDAEEMKAVDDQIIADLDASIADYEAKEKARIAAEHRYDPKVRGQSDAILADYAKSLEEGRLSEGFMSPDQMKALAQLMESETQLRRFVYRELQFFRHFHPASEASRPALQLRAANNSLILKRFLDPEFNSQARSTAKTEIIQAISMRKQILEVSSKGSFRQVAPKGSVAKVDQFTREKILQESLTNSALSDLIVSSTVAQAKAPVKPVAPTFTQKAPELRIPYGASKQSARTYKAQFRSQKEQFKRARQLYAASKEHFKNKLAPEYNRELKRYKGAIARRLMARQAYLMYLAENHPNVFNGTRDGKLGGGVTAKVILEQSKQMLAKRLNRLKQDRQLALRDRVQSNRARRQRLMTSYYEPVYVQTYDDSMDWMMMFYTGNPMWLVNPDIARMELYMDLLSNPSPDQSAYDAARAYQYSYPDSYQNYSDVQAAIDQSAQTYGNDWQEVQALNDARQADGDLDMANQTVRGAIIGAAQNPELYSQLEGDISGYVGEVQNQVVQPEVDASGAPIDSGSLDSDWESFKRSGAALTAEELKEDAALDAVNDTDDTSNSESSSGS